MQCLACGGDMIEQTYEDVVVDRCEDCGGVWVSDEELRAVVTTREAEFAPQEEAQALSQTDEGPETGDRTCPVCGKRLERFNYAMDSRVVLDRCPDDHGVWLDPGELAAVQVLMEEYDEEYAVLAEDLGEAEQRDVKQCPRCDVPLREVSYENVRIDVCPQCEGVWCDDEELAMIVERRSRDFSPDDSPEIEGDEEDAEVVSEDEIPESYDCVVCGRQLNRVNYQYSSGIIIDNCPAGHGTWLDRGEIERVQVFCERWDEQEGLAGKYAGALHEVRVTTEQNVAEDIEDLSPSRFGFMNRFFHALVRRGWA